MDPVRPKILNRPARMGSNCTLESAEEQYRREQDLLAARTKRLQIAEERLLNSLYPTKEHVKAQQHDVLLIQEQYLAAKHEAMQREKQLDREILQKAREKREQAQMGDVRPWTTATLAFSSAAEEREARKQLAATVAADNLVLMAQRSAHRQQQLREQQQQEKQQVASESEFWNLGASSRRWIAPEHRHLAPSSPKGREHNDISIAGPAAAAVVPPWALHIEDSSSSLGGNAMEGTSHRPHTAGGYEYSSQRKHVQHLRPAQLRSVKYPWEWKG